MMADISKCSGVECPLKETCYRYTAKAGFMKSNLGSAPYDKEKEECSYYYKEISE